MTLHPLNGAFERVARAGEHLGDLRPRIETFVQQQADAFRPYFDTSSPPNFCLELPSTAVMGTMRIPILIGETCYNLRTALDYLVFALAKHDSGRAQERTQFPIEDLKERFDGNAPRFLRGVNTAHVARIEDLQPYKGCNWTKALRDISNPDKHCTLVAMRSSHSGVAYTPADPEYAGLALPIRQTPHPAAGIVDVKLDLTCSVEFDDGTPVMQTLEIIKLGVAETLEAFKPEF